MKPWHIGINLLSLTIVLGVVIFYSGTTRAPVHADSRSSSSSGTLVAAASASKPDGMNTTDGVQEVNTPISSTVNTSAISRPDVKDYGSDLNAPDRLAPIVRVTSSVGYCTSRQQDILEVTVNGTYNQQVTPVWTIGIGPQRVLLSQAKDLYNLVHTWIKNADANQTPNVQDAHGHLFLIGPSTVQVHSNGDTMVALQLSVDELRKLDRLLSQALIVQQWMFKKGRPLDSNFGTSARLDRRAHTA